MQKIINWENIAHSGQGIKLIFSDEMFQIKSLTAQIFDFQPESIV